MIEKKLQIFSGRNNSMAYYKIDESILIEIYNSNEIKSGKIKKTW